MREIKFRGKRLDNKEWVEGHYFTTPLTAEFNVKPENGAYFASGDEPIRHCIVDNTVAFEVDPATVGQYTGLKDKNGKEIYEGDIVEWENLAGTNTRSVIAYRERMFCFVDANNNPQEIWCYVFLKIGNIHDNPELLK